eukprot:GHRQ01024076.1.p3 GENE.GHRQ01024076.1~~GHRQ01024076.1.p3  ORF type:complete len:112 (+),score=13.19 GHRQ01024076.1:752-1087(+)
MITSGVAGLLCLAAFCFLQTFVSVYRGRLVSRSLPQACVQQCKAPASPRAEVLLQGRGASMHRVNACSSTCTCCRCLPHMVGEQPVPLLQLSPQVAIKPPVYTGDGVAKYL